MVSPLVSLSSWTFAMAAALMVVGCTSSSDSPSTRHSPAAAASASPRASADPSTAAPSPSATSAFCLDLDTFQVGVVVYRADVGKAIEGESLDVKSLQQRAVILMHIGEEMKASAPPDIAPKFRAVLKAIGTSKKRLTPGTQVRDVVEPVFNEDINPDFDALNTYECGTAGG